jgi:hypothetical protein
MWLMYPAIVTVSIPRSRSQVSRPVPVKLPGRLFSTQWSRGPRRHLRVQLPARGPAPEEGHLRPGERVLDDHDRHPGARRGVHHPQDVVEVAVRVGHRQEAREVLVLHVDHQQGSLHRSSPRR